MNNHGFFALRPDVEARHKLGMLSFLVGIDIDDLADFHVTLMYDVHNTETNDIAKPNTRYEAKVVRAALLKSSLVLILESETMNTRYQQLKDIGKISAYESFDPHVTIVQDYGTQAQVDALNEWLSGREEILVFGNEYSQICED